MGKRENMSVIQHQFRQKDENDGEPADDFGKPGVKPIHLGERAFDNIRFIRETMERSSAFTAIPGYGGALMGLTAIGAAIVAANQTTIRFWLITWLAEATLAFAIGIFAMWQKAKNTGLALDSAPSRKFALAFAPPLIVGIVLTAMFYKNGWFAELPSVWLLLYGAAVITGGAYSVKIVPFVGWLFVLLGAINVFLPTYCGDLMMAMGFGVLQIVFGFVVARNHGG